MNGKELEERTRVAEEALETANKELHVYRVSSEKNDENFKRIEELEARLASIDKETYETTFQIHHPDGTTEEVKAPVYKDESGDEICTEAAIYKIDFYKAKYRLKLAEQKAVGLEKQLNEVKQDAADWRHCAELWKDRAERLLRQ